LRSVPLSHLGTRPLLVSVDGLCDSLDGLIIAPESANNQQRRHSNARFTSSAHRNLVQRSSRQTEKPRDLSDHAEYGSAFHPGKFRRRWGAPKSAIVKTEKL